MKFGHSLLSRLTIVIVLILTILARGSQPAPRTGAALQRASCLEDGPRDFGGHTNEIFSVAFSPDGKYMLTGSNDWTARLWDARTGQVVHVFSGHTSGVTSVAFSPDGKYVLTGSLDSIARLWETQTGKVVRTFVGHPVLIFSVDFSTDGKYVLTGSGDKTARMWDAQSGQVMRTVTGHNPASDQCGFFAGWQICTHWQS